MNEEIYKPCAHIISSVPDQTVDQELLKSIVAECRTLPTFENTAFEHKFVKYYSLLRNEKLRCRWKQYRDNVDKKVFSPFLFPESRDLHFYNGAIKFMPSLSISRQPDQRMKLKPGPRVDWRGQVPIPYEMLMRRGISRKEDKSGGKTHKKHEENVSQNEENNLKINKKKGTTSFDVKKVVKTDKKKSSKQKTKE